MEVQVRIPKDTDVRLWMTSQADWIQRVELRSGPVTPGGAAQCWVFGSPGNAGASDVKFADMYVGFPSSGRQGALELVSNIITVIIDHTPDHGVTWFSSKARVVEPGTNHDSITVESKDTGSASNGPWNDAVVHFAW